MFLCVCVCVFNASSLYILNFQFQLLTNEESWPDISLQSENHFSHLPTGRETFCLCWTLLNEVCVELNTSFFLRLLVGNIGMLSLFTVLKRIVMTLIALSEGSQGMPLLAKHPVALFKYTTVCCVQCVKNTGNALGPSTFIRWERRLASWTLNTLKNTGMLVGKFMVIAFSALFETRDTLFWLLSLIMSAVTQFKKEEVITRGRI